MQGKVRGQGEHRGHHDGEDRAARHSQETGKKVLPALELDDAVAERYQKDENTGEQSDVVVG